jgi:hypothetical protein
MKKAKKGSFTVGSNWIKFDILVSHKHMYQAPYLYGKLNDGWNKIHYAC